MAVFAMLIPGVTAFGVKNSNTIRGISCRFGEKGTQEQEKRSGAR